MSKPAYIFDIDGTLSDLTHRLHFIQGERKDWDGFFGAVADDGIHEHIAAIARAIHAEQAVVIVSGRSDQCRAETGAWLERHKIPYDALYMRRAGDHRPDDKVKQEILADLRDDGWEPVMVFDDRDRVVAMWRELGIPCAQVAPGEF